MTTNHRPQLESKKGKVNVVRDSIVHARALPQHTALKYRRDIDHKSGQTAVEELKQELLEREHSNKRIRHDSESSESGSESELLEELRRLRGENKERKIEASKEKPDEKEESDSESSDSESDTEALLAELKSIRKEEPEKPKSDWRKKTFNVKHYKKAQVHTKNTLESDYHRDFLRNHIK